MTEIKKILNILKFRWPEVILIIGLMAISAASEALSVEKGDAYNDFSLIYMFFSVSLRIAAYLLSLGFLRSVYWNPWQYQTPMSLLKTGLSLFKPMIIFSLFLAPFFLVLISIFFILINSFSAADYTFLNFAEKSPWLFRLCMTAPFIVLIKPVLLMPALIITGHVKVIQCFRSLKNFRLAKATTLLFLFFSSIAFGLLTEFYPNQMAAIVLSAMVHTFIAGVLSIMINLSAIKFVASVKFGYDNDSNVEVSAEQKI
jgi:hypothetical protein